MIRKAACLAVLAAACACVAHAETPQSFSARIGEATFESGDAEIDLIPVMGKFSLSASTQGASAWPPPKTRIDRLAITCDGFEDGKPLLRDHDDFARSTCDVTLEQGRKPMGGQTDAEYHLDKNAAGNRLEITSANGKVYSGTFSFQLKNDKGETVAVTNGRFTAEDRQL